MPIVSKSKRAEYLEQRHPVLHKLCVPANVPTILEFRLNTKLPFCYGRSNDGSPVPADWDEEGVSVIPLWESASGLIAIRGNRGAEEFVQINYEDANDVEIIAKSVDGLFAYLFYFLIESNGGPGTEGFADIQNLAAHLEFDKLSLVVESIPRFAAEQDFDSFWQFTRSF